MFVFRDSVERKDMGGGITLQELGGCDWMSTLHWDLEDGAVVARHAHPQEQFGYVIKGGFKVTIGDETAEIKAGDAYYVPPNVPHEFVAIGDTEAIDVFSPQRHIGA